MRKAPLRSLVRSKNIVAFDVLPDDIVELWVERPEANGLRVIGSFDRLNQMDNMATTLGARGLGVLATAIARRAARG